MFVQLYKLIAAHTNLVTQESFEALFGEPWERALKAGHTREDLLSEVDVDSKKTIHFLFSSHESTSILDHWSIEARALLSVSTLTYKPYPPLHSHETVRTLATRCIRRY